MGYRIQIDYSTGNSFGTHDENECVELTWVNLDVAKKNLQYIKEHYEMYRLLNGYSSRKSHNEICIENQDKNWFVAKLILFVKSQDRCIDESQRGRFDSNDLEYRFDHYYSENCIKLITDDEESMQMSCFWCGYFEHLQSAEIVLDNSDMKIVF